MPKYLFPNLPNYDPYEDAGDIYYYCDKTADKYVNFIKQEIKFTKDKWKGKPFIPAPFQEDLLRCLFGWLRKSDGLRRYSTLFLYIPRKNGKSELIAAIAVAIMFLDNVNDGEIYIGARDRGQALTLYNMARSMVHQNPSLSNEVTPYATTKELRADWDSTKIQAISSDALSIHSLSPSVGIIDEVHAQPNGDLIDALETGMGAREQPLMIYITTADIDRPSVCNEELEYAEGVRDRKFIDPRYLPIIYQTPKDADWRNEEVWKAVNPNYPVTPSKDFMEKAVKKASKSLRKLSSFKRYNLNMKTNNLEGWLDMDDWKAGHEEYEEEELYGMECFAGIDLSSTRDMTNLSLLFDNGRTIARFYVSKYSVENDKTGHYEEWVEEGLLVIAGDKSIDYEYLKSDLLKLRDLVTIRQVAYDPYNATQLSKRLEEEYDFEMVKFGQGIASINEPAKAFEVDVVEGNLKHNNEVLDWQASNVMIYTDANQNIKPMKPNKDSPLKIDGIVSLVMCRGLRILYELENGSVYDNNEIKTV